MSLVEQLRQSTVQVANGSQNSVGSGAGIVWDAGGRIVTNAHVLRSNTVRVIDAHGRAAAARVLRRDAERDLALLETSLALPPVSFANSASIKPGQIVLAVGNPLGKAGAVTMGMIHAVGPLSFGPRRNWIQADVHLAPGNSGGLLANAEGEVIGINTMIFNGLGLAIPSNEAQSFARGETERVRLGVEMIPGREGLIIVGIDPGSLAERAQVMIGDVLRCTAEELRDLLSEVKRSGAADIPVLRGGQKKTLRVHTAQEARAA
jgi:serine protease Do